MLPSSFDPKSDEYESAHLVYSPASRGRHVRWPLISAEIFVPDMDGLHFDRAAIVAANPGALTIHGVRGFSLGRYHEFFVEQPPRDVNGYIMGDAEASLGEATPLAAFLFESARSKWNGAWWDIYSVRIFGVDHADGEIALLNALMRYHDQTGYWPRPFLLGEPEWLDDEVEGDTSAQPLRTGPMIANVEPLRFFNAALQQDDDASACLYLYRIVEYFAFFANSADLSRLRHDPGVSDHDFARRVLDLLARDEKGPILRIIAALADESIASAAVTAGLAASASVLGEAIYTFRNSIVHGKYSYGFTLQSGSAIETDQTAAKWRVILSALARKALTQYGRIRA